MSKAHDYTVVTAEERAASRQVVRLGASAKKQKSSTPNRIFVPFTGFDGQKLAGSGALVWEGELLR